MVPPGRTTAPVTTPFVRVVSVRVDRSLPTAAPAGRPNCGTTFNNRNRPTYASPLLIPLGGTSWTVEAIAIDLSLITSVFDTAAGVAATHTSATAETRAQMPLIARTLVR